MSMMFETDAYALRAIKRVGYEFTTAQTDTVLWTPIAESRFVITDYEIYVGGATGGTIAIFNDNNGPMNWMIKTDVAPATTGPVSFNSFYTTPFVATNKNDRLKITTSAAITVRVLLRGYDVGMDHNATEAPIPV
jgi:hypothetical protein